MDGNFRLIRKENSGRSFDPPILAGSMCACTIAAGDAKKNASRSLSEMCILLNHVLDQHEWLAKSRQQNAPTPPAKGLNLLINEKIEQLEEYSSLRACFDHSSMAFRK
jgi:hypothetical protein